MTYFVLGSASPSRKKLLQSAGIDPLIRVSNIDEQAVWEQLPPETLPPQIVTALATAKAHSLLACLEQDLTEDCVLLCCDSLLYIRGQLVGKPMTDQRVKEQWTLMAGHAGQVYTGHILMRLYQGNLTGSAVGADNATVQFGHPSSEDLEAYIASRQPHHVAGGFTLEAKAGWFIDSIVGSPSTVIGVSLPLVATLLSQLGFHVSHFWNSSTLLSFEQ